MLNSLEEDRTKGSHNQPSVLFQVDTDPVRRENLNREQVGCTKTTTEKIQGLSDIVTQVKGEDYYGTDMLTCSDQGRYDNGLSA